MGWPPSVRPHVLIVDDLPDNIGLLTGALEDEYDVQFSLDGLDALKQIEKKVPDLVLLDVMMPGIDGMETLRRLRDSAWGCDVPVILVTADNSVDTQVRGLELGADDFLAKPVVIPVLLVRVRNALQRHRLIMEQRRLVAELENGNRELTRLSELNRVILNSAGEGIFSIDLAGICLSINPAALEMLGFAEEDIVGRNQHEVFHDRRPDGTPYPAADCPVSLTLRDGCKRSVEETFIRRNGQHLPVLLTVSPMHFDGRMIGAEVFFQDISERQRMQRELQILATTDELTGVCNRRHFFEQGDSERLRAARYGHPGGLLMLDLDRFKQINDSHGHAAGDAVLKEFAACIRGLLRGADRVGRIGGEEFAVLLPQTDLAGSVAFAERLRAAIEAIRLPWSDGVIAFTASIGATVFDIADTRLEDALIRADRGMYVAKAAGRNRVEAIPPGVDAEVAAG